MSNYPTVREQIWKMRISALRLEDILKNYRSLPICLNNLFKSRFNLIEVLMVSFCAS